MEEREIKVVGPGETVELISAQVELIGRRDSDIREPVENKLPEIGVSSLS